jgi:hypothetical protein
LKELVDQKGKMESERTEEMNESTRNPQKAKAKNAQ